MKYRALLLAFLGCFSSCNLWATSQACGTILCLGGSMDSGTNPGGEMCEKPIDAYFDIKEYRGGEYAPDLTLEARIDYLDECPEDTETKMRINAKYGMIPNNPIPKNHENM